MRGLKVVEVASVLAGPSVGMFFAELGADVIKVENKLSNGDVTRQWKLPKEDQSSNTSAYFRSINWGKTHTLLDLRDNNDLQQLDELLSDADILITNFRAGKAETKGLDFPTLHKKYPQLIVGNITGYGQNSKRAAYDVVLQAESGIMYMNGAADGGPVKFPFALIDVLAAHQLKEGLLVALLQRTSSKKGSLVSVSLLEAALATLINQSSNWLNAQHEPQRMGSLHPNIAPYGDTFETRDGKTVVLAVGNDSQFRTLCESLNSDAHENSLFLTNQDRVKNRNALSHHLAECFMQHDHNIIAELHSKHVPFGEIRKVSEAVESDAADQLKLTFEDGAKTIRGSIFRINGEFPTL